MADCVTIHNGSALDLPCTTPPSTAPISQNVVLNIADKPRFYREEFRVLRPGGVLALSNVCVGPAGPLRRYSTPFTASPVKNLPIEGAKRWRGDSAHCRPS